MQSCFFTGHRRLPFDCASLTSRCLAAVRGAYLEGCRTFLSGGALGFDMLAADCVCRLRDSELSDITLQLILPCRDQDAHWLPAERAHYAALLARADGYRYLAERYYDGAMQARNHALVDAADYGIAYLRYYASGTGGTVAYARKRGITVLNLSEL